jgi:hypothetical protein
MANLNDRDRYNPINPPINPPPAPTDAPNGYVTGTNETNLREGTTPRQAAYRDGYVHGQQVEQRRVELNQDIRDNDTAARGLLLGILLTGAVGLATAAYFLSQRPQTPAPTRETIVVPRNSPVPQSPAPAPQVQERIIERDRIVPVPQPAAPAAPSVNNTEPQSSQPAPVAPVAPATGGQPAAPANTDPGTAPLNTSPTTPTGSESNPATTTTQPEATNSTTGNPTTNP